MHPADYEIGPAIGYGSSAIVYLSTYLPTGRQVGIKMIDLDQFERNQIDELRKEIQIMSLSKHPNLLPVYGSFVNGSKLYIVMPFLQAGSCLDMMRTAHPEGFEETVIATILKQGLQGLEYLHRNGQIHRDVKAGNLLASDDGLVQLADFGVSSSLMDTGERKGMRKTFVGTPCWMAPEVMEQSGYDYKADIWSFGITALELATGHAPFAKFPPIKVLMLTLQNDPPTLDRDSTRHKYSKSFKDMIDTCLQKDPARRPTAEKLLQHPFFKLAKKKEYLVKTLLGDLAPLAQRAHNRRAPRNDQQMSQKGVSWDFDDASDDGASRPSGHDASEPVLAHPPPPLGGSSTGAGHPSRSVSFAPPPAAAAHGGPTPGFPAAYGGQQPPPGYVEHSGKRVPLASDGSSGGGGSGSERPSVTFASSTGAPSSLASSTQALGPPGEVRRKSRFVVSDANSDAADAALESAAASYATAHHLHDGGGVGGDTPTHGSPNQMPAHMAASGQEGLMRSASVGAPLAGLPPAGPASEIRKGRFSVTDAGGSPAMMTATPTTATSGTPLASHHSGDDGSGSGALGPAALARITNDAGYSHSPLTSTNGSYADGLGGGPGGNPAERKTGRFAVSRVPSASSATATGAMAAAAAAAGGPPPAAAGPNGAPVTNGAVTTTPVGITPTSTLVPSATTTAGAAPGFMEATPATSATAHAPSIVASSRSLSSSSGTGSSTAAANAAANAGKPSRFRVSSNASTHQAPAAFAAAAAAGGGGHEAHGGETPAAPGPFDPSPVPPAGLLPAETVLRELVRALQTHHVPIQQLGLPVAVLDAVAELMTLSASASASDSDLSPAQP